MRPCKIVLIGAGSASFGLGTLATLLRDRGLAGSTVCLVDLNAEGLEMVHQLGDRMVSEWGSGVTLQSAANRREALRGADFVAVSIETGPREELWRKDYQLTIPLGLRQPYAENGGPGGFAHTMRNIPPMIDIARDMQELCPGAWLINLTNPLPRLCRAVTRYTDVKTVGLCHQIYYAYLILGLTFAEEIGLQRPPVVTNGASYELLDAIGLERYHLIVATAMQKLSIKSAGLNHFIWALDIRRRETGEDLYPRLQDRLDRMPASFEPLAREVYKLVGAMPIAGDTHICEYLPWLTNAQRQPWSRFSVRLYHWDRAAAERDEMWQRISAMVRGEEPIDVLRDSISEGVHEIITGVAGDRNCFMEAVNLPNHGLIANLPQDTIVEVPGLANMDGVNGIAMGELPPMVAELCRREAALVEVLVQAGVEGDRDAALQALLLDPHVDDIELAKDILKTYLDAFAEWLPQFHGRWQWNG